MEQKFKDLLESSKYTPLASSEAAMMELMLENTDKETARLIAEGTLSGDVAQFTPILMPMVRRVYPNLIANELLGVQPMSMPTGFIYALTNQYTKFNGVATNSLDNTNGAGINSSVIITVTDATGLNVGDTISASANASVADPIEDAVGVIKYVEGTNLIVAITSGAFGVGMDVADAATVAQGTDNPILTVYTNEAAFAKILKGFTGTYTTAQAEQLGTDMSEIGFSIAKKSVEAKSRALKGQYTVEMYQDLKAQHGLLADEEIMSLMSYEMQAEIDREIVDFVNSNATQLGDTVGSFTAANDSTGRWEIEKYRREAVRFSKEAAQIGLDTKRGQGNVLVVSPKVVTMLEQLGGFKAATVAGSVNQPISGGVAGTFDNRFKVIVDQYATSDYATVMYKGADRRDAMGFFAPYVPMSFTKVTNADSGQPAVIAKTRYALDTIPGIASATSNDRAKKYARSYGISFANTVLA